MTKQAFIEMIENMPDNAELYEVEAENRALAEVKAKELYKDYKNSNDFFTPSDVSHVKDTFKIVPAVLVDIREALCKECAQKEGK